MKKVCEETGAEKVVKSEQLRLTESADADAALKGLEGLEDPLARTSPKVVFEKSAGAHIAIFVFNFRRRGEDVLQQIKQLAKLYK